MPDIIIKLLEDLGRKPGIAVADGGIAAAVDGSALDPRERQALLDHDAAALRALAGRPAGLRCLIATPD